jgi:uncharacterized protein (TIGR04442 family)
MHQEISLHGHLDDAVEYFAVLAAHDAYARYFFETDADGLRFFAPGNEFMLGHDRISHRGNGGSFCSYMFGVDLPLADLCKTEVRNRLILYGAFCTEDGQLDFTGQTEGYSSYERIFADGNALRNYFFFLNGEVAGSLSEQQGSIARLLGKTLKRSVHVGGDDDTGLLKEIYGLLGHRSSLCLVKLVHKHHRAYHEAFRALYLPGKAIAEDAYGALQRQAEQWRISRSQQERIRIDVMYQHPDNRRIVDEYRNILVECHQRGAISQFDSDRLDRLRTLSIRNKIPSALFALLDEKLRRDQTTGPDVPDYLIPARQVLGGILVAESQSDACITAEELQRLLYAKHQANLSHDRAFEQLLLDTGRACDERLHQGGAPAILEQFNRVVDCFDRYDRAYASLNELTFMDNCRAVEEKLRSLLDDKQAFDQLAPDLWQELLLQPLLANKYLGRFGRRKAECLAAGLPAIAAGRMTVPGVRQELADIETEGRFFATVLSHVRERIQHFYARYATTAEQDALCRDVTRDLQHKGLLAGELSPVLFRDVLVDINKEAVYLHNLLPQIVAANDAGLRADFLANSGLEHFAVEELENAYFARNGLDPEQLVRLRKGAA